MRYHLLLALLVLCGTVAIARADGGKPKVSEQWNNYRVSVFLAPDPARVGPVEVSVMVQDLGSGKSRTNLKTTIYATPKGQKEPKIGGLASTEEMTNKLMVGRILQIPEVGKWQIVLQIEGPNGDLWRNLIDLDVAEPIPAWMNYAFYIGWPVGAVALFFVHRTIVRRRTLARGGLPPLLKKKDRLRR